VNSQKFYRRKLFQNDDKAKKQCRVYIYLELEKITFSYKQVAKMKNFSSHLLSAEKENEIKLGKIHPHFSPLVFDNNDYIYNYN